MSGPFKKFQVAVSTYEHSSGGFEACGISPLGERCARGSNRGGAVAAMLEKVSREFVTAGAMFNERPRRSRRSRRSRR